MVKEDKNKNNKNLIDKNLSKVSHHERSRSSSIGRSSSNNRSKSSNINCSNEYKEASQFARNSKKSNQSKQQTEAKDAKNKISNSVNNLNNINFYDNDIHDLTSSESDENDSMRNAKYKNGRKSKHPVRQFFKIELKDGKRQIGICNSCQQECTISCGSDANLRTHLAYIHDKPEVLTPAQLERFNRNKGTKQIPGLNLI